MGRADGIDRDLDRAFGQEAVLTTAQLSWALRIGEQTIRIAAKSIAPAPKKLGHTYAWSRADARRLLLHLGRRPRAGAAAGAQHSEPPPDRAA